MTDYIATQKIADYVDSSGAYHSTGPLTGEPLSVAQPSIIASNGSYNFFWTLADDFGTFTDLGIIGVKLTGEFDGSGTFTWNWTADNPGYPSAAEWTSGTTYGSHMTMEGNVAVDGPTTWEHIVNVADTASDPIFVGYSYPDFLADLEISLHALASGVDGYDHVYGQAEGSGSIDILSFDLVLYTTLDTGAGNVVVTRLWPRDDALGLGTANRLVPTPRAGRIIGRQP